MVNRVLIAASLLLIATGCRDKDPDNDEDGWTVDQGDCDDDDPTVYPGADEYCNGQDNDCNGVIDDHYALDKLAWYVDADGDGYGDPDTEVWSCDQPEGTVDNGLDCDDEDPDIYPGADEYCDGVDTDCNGVVDDSYAVDATAWYRDDDGDGYGDPDHEVLSCEEPEGYIDNDLDCDDERADVNPDAEEVCDGVDNDCNGLIDDGALDLVEWYYDGDGDGYGDPDLSIVECTPPEGYVSEGGDCDDTDATVYPGADEYCNGLDNDCNGVVDDDYALDATTWYEDADGDGFGNADSAVVACSASGFVANDEDCDDTDATVYPGADEYCNGLDNDCNGVVDDNAIDERTWYLDYDSDGYGGSVISMQGCSPASGYVDNADDCNDLNASAYPGADEYCNGVDNDCNGVVDDDYALDAPTWYQDADGDGYGDPGTSTVTCSSPSGYVADGSDCDDTDATAYPGADEYCNGVDNDCNGVVDDNYALDVATWYQDSDGDGYGNSAVVTFACNRPSGYGAASGDCNDTDATVYPGADEYCNLLDNDCNGVVDDDYALDASTWYQDSDTDGYGDSSVSTTACTRPSGYVADGTDCDDTDSTVNPGVDEICNDGIDNDCDGVLGPCVLALDSSDTIFLGDSSSDNAGSAVVGCGDLNGDGYDDIAIGAEYADGSYSASNTGATYVFYGPISAGTIDVSTADVIMAGEASSDQSGSALAGGGDVDGDGLADLLISGKRNSAGVGTATGAAYLFYGPVTAPTSSLSDADVKFSGSAAWDFTAIYLAFAGDVDGDGRDDLLITANSNDISGPNAGTVYLIYGSGSLTDMSLTYADIMFTGEAGYDYAGVPASAGDTDGDGLDDIIIGVPGQSLGGTSGEAGLAYLFWADGLVDGTTYSLGDANVQFYGASAGDRLGAAVASAGDVDGDGYDDILVSATKEDTGGNNAGAAYVILGADMTDGLYTDPSLAYITFIGDGSDNQLGASVARPRDFDGDGHLDFLISATQADNRAGAAYLFLGPLSGTVSVTAADATYEGTADNDYAGNSIDFAGDIHGTGAQDSVIIGARYNDDGGVDAGSAYIITGLSL